MSSTGHSTGRGTKFREVYCGAVVKTIFITVPGVGTPALASWSNGDGGIWLTSIPPTSAPDIAVYCFEHGVRADEDFSWKALFDQGADLLDELIKLGAVGELSECPIILIAHSLGGIIVKEAMGLIHQQAVNFPRLWRAVAGAIFLGTPHSQSNDLSSWQTASAILRLHSGSKNTKILMTPSVAKRLLKISLSFEQAFDLIPVFSAYELRETKVGGFLSAKSILVDQNLAKTGVKLEKLVGIDADHNKICCLKVGSGALNEISTFLDSAVRDALGRIKRHSDEYVMPPILDGQTVRESPCASLSDFEDMPSSLKTTNITSFGSTSLGFDMIPLVADFSIDRKDPKLPCYIMPPHPRNRVFFGRTGVLQSLRERLLPKKVHEDDSSDEPNLNMFALCGSGGIGKTEVATEFVYTSKDCYDAIFWVQADEQSKLSQGYTSIATKLGLVLEDSVDSRDPVVVQDLVKGWLSNPVKTYQHQEKQPKLATWLLIFDNVDDPNILDDFWPFEYWGGGAVLITSRDPLARTYMYSEENPGITLPPFTTQEATNFLLKLTRREGEEMEIISGSAVAERLGGLPLALTQMAGVIDRRDLSFSEFLQIFEEEDVRSKFFKLSVGNTKVRSKYEHTLDTVWALEKLNKSSSTLLDVLSLLDPDGISEAILEKSLSQADLEDYPRTSAAYQDARTELLRSSLIARDRTTNRITIHRLVQDGARSKMTAERFESVFALTSKLLCLAWPFEDFNFGHGVSRWGKCAELFPHVIQLHRFSSRLGAIEIVTEESLLFPRLLGDAGRFNHQRGNSIESTAYFETAAAMCTTMEDKLSKHNGPQTDAHLKKIKTLSAEISHDLGCIATETNQPEAALLHFSTFNTAMLDFSGGKSQKKDKRLAVSWNELGNAHMMNEEWTRGEDCFIRSMNALKQLDDFKEVDLSFPMINLAFSYWLQGRLEEADRTLAEILAVREAAYGINDRESFMTGKLLHAYGNVKWSQGKPEESFAFHLRGLQQYKSTIGNHHHRTADLCVKVSNHYTRLDQYDVAMSLLDQALKIYGDCEYYDPEKARALYKKGKLLQHITSEGNKSKKPLHEALDLYRKLKKEKADFRRGVCELTDADFDDLIVFWSK